MDNRSIVIVKNDRKQRFELHRATCWRVEGRAELSSLLPDFDWSSTSYGEPISVTCCKVGPKAIDRHFRIQRGETVPEKPNTEFVARMNQCKQEAKAIMWVLKSATKEADLSSFRAARAGVTGLGMLLDDLIALMANVDDHGAQQ